ncbi:MAG: retroviral-like aspartic protease family protein [Vitreoscilla sp.]
MTHLAGAAAPRALAGAILALVFAWPAAASAGCSIKTMALPVKMVGHRAIATVGINGTPVPLMVDTGAFFSMLTEAAAAQLQLKLGPMPYGMQVEGLAGRVHAHTTTVSHLQLVKGEIPDVEFVVGGNEPGDGAMGLMGRNLLSFTDVEFDLAHGVIRFVVPNDDCDKVNMAYWAGETPVSELKLQREHGQRNPELRADIELNGHRVTAVFDSGAGTVVSLEAAHRVGVKDGDMKPAGKAAGVGAGRVDSWTAPFASVDFGGEAVQHNRLEVAAFEMEEDMLIGIDFFLSHHIYVSKKQSKMFFTYNGGPIFALNVGDRGSAQLGEKAADALKADEFARRGAASKARGDLAGALADLDRACALEPDNAEFFATRASIQTALGHLDKALADLDNALRLDPAQDAARMQRAWMLGEGEDRVKAQDELATLDKRLAPQSDLRRQMAALYGRLYMPAQAVAQWNLWIPAHKHDVDSDDAYNSRCWARVEMGTELDKALDDCDEAVDADSKNASFLDSRAWVYLRQGKLKKAMADFDRALAIKPGQATSLYGRGLVHQRQSETAAAQADLAAARKARPDIDTNIAHSGLPAAAP